MAAQIKEVWVALGSTPVVRIKTSESGYPYYVFSLNSPGNKEMLSLVQTAIAQNLSINIYVDKSVPTTLHTGLSSPDVADVTGDAFYTMTINR